METVIRKLEARIKRLEDFITREQNVWDSNSTMLEQGSLESSVVDIVGSEFRVDATVRLLKSDENLSDWS